jgi:hypothetical protein
MIHCLPLLPISPVGTKTPINIVDMKNEQDHCSLAACLLSALPLFYVWGAPFARLKLQLFTSCELQVRVPRQARTCFLTYDVMSPLERCHGVISMV